jgi:tRNA(Ile)-lysidine synthase
VPIAEQALQDEEAVALFEGLQGLRGLVLAVSGGPDSTALLVMAARWAQRLRKLKSPAPKLIAVTIDHGLRPESAREAQAVKRLARRLGITHRTLRWRGGKPATGLQEAARAARYQLLAEEAARVGYAHVLTAHTLDDQAETVLFRLARGSGLTGLAGMARVAPLPASRRQEMLLLRPLLGVPKTQLIATLEAAGIAHSDDPTNRDPRFARARLRTLMPALAREGLDARGLVRLAARMRRAEAAIEFAVEAACAALAPPPWAARGPIAVPRLEFAHLPAEVALRVLGRAVAHVGNEGPVELAKLEHLYAALRQARAPLRRTLAGALISLTKDRLIVERAPARRKLAMRSASNRSFSK